jgi:hypothetical protein
VDEEADATEQIADAMATQLAPREEKIQEKKLCYNLVSFLRNARSVSDNGKNTAPQNFKKKVGFLATARTIAQNVF